MRTNALLDPRPEEAGRWRVALCGLCEMSQKTAILDLLKRGPITARDAQRHIACDRAAARVRELREQGYPVETTMIQQNGKRFALYSLDSTKLQRPC